MKIIRTWELVSETKGICWTYRMKVQGGWLYRHTEIILETSDPFTQKRNPHSGSMSLCFVPDVKKKVRRK